jgi:hypothetical protein
VYGSSRVRSQSQSVVISYRAVYFLSSTLRKRARERERVGFGCRGQIRVFGTKAEHPKKERKKGRGE